jgi:hypothetical protein
VNISQNPYSITTSNNPVLKQTISPGSLKIIQDEENNCKAPKTLPEPLPKLVDILGNVYVSMIQAKGIVDQTANNVTSDSAKLDLIKCKIDNINKEIVDLSYHLSIMSL